MNRLAYWLLCLGVLPWATALAGPPVGRFRAMADAATELSLSSVGRLYRIELSGGGAAGAADCLVRAEGPLRGRSLDAQFIPVETELFEYSAEQAAAEHRQVTVRFDRNGATVLRADTVGYCGWTASFVGRYRKLSR